MIAGVLAVDYFAYPYGSFDSGRSGNRCENGLWLRYTWYFGERSDNDLKQLCRDLSRREIKYGYFHVRSIEQDGRLKYHFPHHAKKLNSTLHKLAPGVKRLAWVYAGNSAGLGEVDLGNKSVRRTMVHEAVWLVKDCGFDGVQWDYEICSDGDAGFLSLLHETRAAMPADAIVSVAAPMWLPWPIGRWGWSDSYMRQVAKECDQVAVMCYDSGFWLPRSYCWLLRQQAVHFTREASSAKSGCRILLGVPTYGAAGMSHNIRAENLRMALKAARDVTADPALDARTFAGVAIFADYTTETDEWADYERLWLGRPGQ